MTKISEATFNELQEVFNKAVEEAFGAGVKEGREGSQSTVDEPVIKSPNQQRAELNLRAREFVESKYLRGNFGTEKVIHGYHGHNTVEFIVNREKNTVVALLRLAYGWTGKVEGKGIAKCIPGDVFNEWIGKAIALARAMEIDIPEEFTDAVQPDEVVQGVIIKFSEGSRYEITEVVGESDAGIDYVFRNLVTGNDGIKAGYMNLLSNASIIDDTNAEYSS